ncbi:FliO/MopB family protein [Rhodopirellula sp. MGV]|uniref:FliO/MopB family protein n=1 Tax=Rhodopirellula sp. MGV TaxID=2023130 RepID=UPI000B969D6F|nr:flagellar biosynthetic protein FliO [Rhodopirellula sp. MGV]OYP29848.1 hypothetical protein CGZ80_23960 [Rhodopirellula sp. MGV]PNY33730.1 hypothetical protein C2E31_26935 [Rhodopirellula baltica]
MSKRLALSICGLLLLCITSGSPAMAEFPELVYPDEAGEVQNAESEGLLPPMVLTTVSALAVVLAVFGGLVWVSRSYGGTRKAAGSLPDDVFCVLGTSSIDARTRVSYVRVGERLLLIGQTQNGDPVTLAEIVDPDEVERITARCQGRPEIVGRRTTSSSPSGTGTITPIRRSGMATR